MDFQNFNFAVSPLKWRFLASISAFSVENFPTRKHFFDNFSTAQNLGQTGTTPLAPKTD